VSPNRLWDGRRTAQKTQTAKAADPSPPIGSEGSGLPHRFGARIPAAIHRLSGRPVRPKNQTPERPGPSSQSAICPVRGSLIPGQAPHRLSRLCGAFRAAKHRLKQKSVGAKPRNRPGRAVPFAWPPTLRGRPRLRSGEAERGLPPRMKRTALRKLKRNRPRRQFREPPLDRRPGEPPVSRGDAIARKWQIGRPPAVRRPTRPVIALFRFIRSDRGCSGKATAATRRSGWAGIGTPA
jgi:hypothetical protein